MRRKAIRWNRAAAAVALAVASAAQADTWTNGSGDGLWQTNANWQDSSAPSLSDDVLFPTPGPASHTLTIAAGGPAANAHALQFDADYAGNPGGISFGFGVERRYAGGVHGGRRALMVGLGMVACSRRRRVVG